MHHLNINSQQHNPPLGGISLPSLEVCSSRTHQRDFSLLPSRVCWCLMHMDRSYHGPSGAPAPPTLASEPWSATRAMSVKRGKAAAAQLPDSWMVSSPTEAAMLSAPDRTGESSISSSKNSPEASLFNEALLLQLPPLRIAPSGRPDELDGGRSSSNPSAMVLLVSTVVRVPELLVDTPWVDSSSLPDSSWPTDPGASSSGRRHLTSISRSPLRTHRQHGLDHHSALTPQGRHKAHAHHGCAAIQSLNLQRHNIITVLTTSSAEGVTAQYFSNKFSTFKQFSIEKYSRYQKNYYYS